MFKKRTNQLSAAVQQVLSWIPIRRPLIRQRGKVALLTVAGLFLLTGTRATAQTVLFTDDFSGPALKPIWQAYLPDAPEGGDGTFIETYVGGPNYNLSSLDGHPVLLLGNTLYPHTRTGWSSITNFTAPDFRYEVRFNTLGQGSISVDGFIEIWIMDATDSSRYDIAAPFGGNYGQSRCFFAGSSIDNVYNNLPFNFENNTYYRLVLESAPGQHVRGYVLSDSGTELIGWTFAHGASAFGSGFKIVLSQFMGSPAGPCDAVVAANYVKLTKTSGPTITNQPQSQMTNAGANVTLSVAASSLLPMTYQWRFNGTNLAGMTATSLQLTNVQPQDSGDYVVVVSNSVGYAISDPATLTVLIAPEIVLQPQGQVGYWGKNASFSVESAGSAPLSYRWYKDNLQIPWATNSTIVLTNLDFNDAGDYQVLVSNPLSSVLSASAWLTVNPAWVALGMYPGLTIDGVVGKNYGIQYITNVSHTNDWTTLTTLILTQSVQLWVDTSVNASVGTNAQRFYRVIAIP